MAITHSPTLRRFTSPIFTAGSPVASILTTATSVRLSLPTILALNSRLSVSVTMTSSAPSTTWALVITKPSAVRMKPEPTPRGCSSSGCDRGWGRWRGTLGTGRPKRRKNSSMSSSMPSASAELADTFSSVRMLTTEGPTCSTRSVKSGSPLTTAPLCAWAALTGTSIPALPAASARTPASVQDCSVFHRTVVMVILSISIITLPRRHRAQAVCSDTWQPTCFRTNVTFWRSPGEHRPDDGSEA